MVIENTSGQIDDGFGEERNYDSNTDCSWLIEAAQPDDSLYNSYLVSFTLLDGRPPPSHPSWCSRLHTLFAVEESSACVYDYLSVYDGPGDSSPLIGR